MGEMCDPTSPPQSSMAALLFDDISEGLQLVKCPFEPPDTAALKGMLGGKACSQMYTKIVVWLCEQMPGSVEVVSLPGAPDEEPLFRVELSTALMELGCPVPGIGGADSLTDPNNKTAVLHYLIHELMNSRLSAVNSSSTNQVNTEKGCFSGHPALEDLAIIYNILELPSPGSEDEIPDIFETIINKINHICKKRSTSKDELLSSPMFKFSYSPEQWQKLEVVCRILNEEYSVRFKTLLKRLDLTLTSFKWSKSAKEKVETIDKVYDMQRRLMKEASTLGVAEILAAREDLACVPKTSSGAVRDNTQSKLNKMVIVGKVPDRGGRPMEQRPEPEIPSWHKDKNRGGGRGASTFQQSRGGQNQAAGGNRYQQSDRNQGRQQNRGSSRGQNQGGQSSDQGQDSGRGGGGQYHNRGNRGRGGSWGGYRRGSNQGGVY